MKAWTDYPFVELGDVPNQEAPIRRIDVLSYDQNKYCKVRVCGVESGIKLGYIYERPERLGIGNRPKKLRRKRVECLPRETP